MKFTADRPYADPEKAARRLMEMPSFRASPGWPDLCREAQRPVSCSATKAEACDQARLASIARRRNVREVSSPTSKRRSHYEFLGGGHNKR